MKRIGIAVATLAVVVSPALADCAAELAEIDRKLAAAKSDQPHLMQILKQLRDQGAAECEAGNETGAGARFKSIDMMLDIQAQLPAPQSTPERSVETKKEPAVRKEAVAPEGGSDLLPYVVVKDPEAVDSLDWAALRKRAGTDYPSRWDDLTLLDSCLWITASELAEHLGLSARLTAKKVDHKCKYRVHLPNGDSGVFLSVHVELHESTEYPRKAETGFSEGASGMQFTPFDPGAPDLNVYVNKKGKYLYVFPGNGRSYWRLGYKPSYGMDEVYRPEAGSGIDQDIGPRFMKLLVDKYGARM